MDINFSKIKPVPYKTKPEQKIKSKEAAHRLKFGSPKLRDLLREKCRIRMKESRDKAYNDCRPIISDRTLFNRIVREEIENTVEFDITLQEQMYKELLEDSEKWFAEEFEKEEKYLIEQGEPNILICPVCQSSNLECDKLIISCKCGVYLDGKQGLEYLSKALNETIRKHELNVCDKNVIFIPEPKLDQEIQSLLGFCEDCDFMAQILN